MRPSLSIPGVLVVQSAFLRMNVGTSRSSERAFIMGRGKSSEGRCTNRGEAAGIVDTEAAEAIATDSSPKPVAITVIFI
jgi:hypothetical protein